jgi:UDP-N-acetylglucosamine 4-epimerase
VSSYDAVKLDLLRAPRRWLVTGVAGFIGSHLAEQLLHLRQTVVGIDNFSTGSRRNLEEITLQAPPDMLGRFRLIEGDIRDPRVCRAGCDGADIVLHQAALGSVPRSLEDPRSTHEVNVNGTFNMLMAARDARVLRFVYASSSAVYGDEIELPKREDRIGKPLSPYAASKYMNEVHGDVFHRVFGLETIGLRYFNVFGPRQDPSGPYAAVVPLWFAGLRRAGPVYINGDGETSRDFCYVANAVQANLLAATATSAAAIGEVYNIAVGQRTTLNELFAAIRLEVARVVPAAAGREAGHRDFRTGDIRHSQADISKASRLLGYQPSHTLAEGLRESARWYLDAAPIPSAAPA